MARGPSLGRTLTMAEAEAGMGAMLSGAAAPEQTGALLATLRLRGETAEELAGFVRAARAAALPAPPSLPAVLDWPSYADHHKQLPYFVLAALLLARSGTPVLMHGIAGAGTATTPAVLAALGIAPAATWQQAAAALGSTGFAYLPLEAVCPPLARLIGLRALLGIRTVANSVARALNPAAAAHQIVGVFHPDYQRRQAEAACLLGQPHALVIRGAGGEAQRNPEKPCLAAVLCHAAVAAEAWPALVPGQRHPWRTEELDPACVAALWRGDWLAPGPEAAVVGTAAMALRLVGRAPDPAAAQALAEELWGRRGRTARLS